MAATLSNCTNDAEQAAWADAHGHELIDDALERREQPEPVRNTVARCLLDAATDINDAAVSVVFYSSAETIAHRRSSVTITVTVEGPAISGGIGWGS